MNLKMITIELTEDKKSFLMEKNSGFHQQNQNNSIVFINRGLVEKNRYDSTRVKKEKRGQ